jgi:hypothetical protein
MEKNTDRSMSLFIAIITKIGSAIFMAAAPLIFLGILYQGGLGTVPVYNRGGQVIFYVNNVVAALVFSWLWFSISALMFSFSKKAVAKFRKQRDAA